MSKERKKIIKQLDSVFSKYIRERDNYKCITCAKDSNTSVIQCGHLFSRVSHSTRWDEKNAYAQCSGCNLAHEYNFEAYRRVWVEKNGEKEYDKLYAKYSNTTKFSDSDLKFLIKYYRQKVDEINEKKI